MSDHNHAQEEIKFTDENGNNICFNLETFVNGTGDDFQGYLVSPMAIQPDVNGENQAEANKKIYEDAKRYFNEHPEQRPQDGYSQEISYTTAYLRIQADKEIRKRVSEGNASRLQQVYVHQMDTKVGQKSPQIAYAWEQINGGMSLDAPAEEVVTAMRRDITAAAMKQHAAENQQAIKLGAAALRVRMNQPAPQVTGTIKTGELSAPVQQTSQNTVNNTFSREEVAAIIANKVSRGM